MICEECGQRCGLNQGHISVENHNGAIKPTQRLLRLQHSVPCTVLFMLANTLGMGVMRVDAGFYIFRLMPGNNDGFGGLERGHGIQHVQNKFASRQLVQHFGGVGFHAGAFARG